MQNRKAGDEWHNTMHDFQPLRQILKAVDRAYCRSSISSSSISSISSFSSIISTSSNNHGA